MQQLTAADVQIIAKGMQIQNTERELRENRQKWTNKELTEWERKMKQQLLNSLKKQYRRLVKKNDKFDEYGHYLEQQAEMRREEEKLRAYEEREEYLNDMGLEEYDLYTDR